MSNRNNFMEAEKERSQAERLRADLFRTVKVTDQMTRTRQQCNTRKLGIDNSNTLCSRYMYREYYTETVFVI